ncbi:hypothetical protein J2X06_001707 [Lysobacter niastensis]|uniref:DUF4194 domain-containing protein n=1 Tax=Lysobacter niastensis TaxID=380629 RepID=A0ABU1WAD5_9GAMM|nr:hypothetical protein [Lysobacter niastensis]MDR7134523.1 hypothetical protein [Lysobacter niastensis]
MTDISDNPVQVLRLAILEQLVGALLTNNIDVMLGDMLMELMLQPKDRHGRLRGQYVSITHSFAAVFIDMTFAEMDALYEAVLLRAELRHGPLECEDREIPPAAIPWGYAGAPAAMPALDRTRQATAVEIEQLFAQRERALQAGHPDQRAEDEHRSSSTIWRRAKAHSSS